MKIITRYLYKQFFVFFFISLIIFLVVYMVIEFFGKIDNFFEANATVGMAIAFLLYKAPFIILQLIPVSVLISVMLMLGLLSKHNEILALKSSGMSMYNLASIIVGISVIVGIGSFFLSESIVPITSPMANDLWDRQIEEKDSKGAYKLSHIWYKGKKTIYQIRTFDTTRNIAEGFTVFFFDRDFTVIKRIDAKSARWNDGVWYLQEGLIQDIEGGNLKKSERFVKYAIQLPEIPNNFKRSMKAPEEMSFWELKKYTKKIREEGYDATQYLVDLNIKVAFPFICPVLTLVGIPLALSRRRGGIPFSITIGIGVSFLYLLTFGISRSFAISGLLPPVLGAWMANLLFSLFGIYLILAAESH